MSPTAFHLLLIAQLGICWLCYCCAWLAGYGRLTWRGMRLATIMTIALYGTFMLLIWRFHG